ncbi:MAG: CvpA family protein, partial [Patescibacteria group bacterium]|nr:CvpA family protein [Patescibacteria group bacterium]
MSIFDIILLIILAGFVFYGLFFGLIRTLGSLAGVIIGAWLASRFYLEVFSWVGDLSFGFNNLGKVVVFIILFTLINRLVCFAFVILD